jgi:hypothetical protein
VAAAPRGGAGAKSGNGPAAAATPQPETKMAAARPTPNGSTGGQGQGNSGEGQRPNSPAKSDDKTKINDKKDEEKRPVEQRRADRADRLSKADKSRKGSASTGDDGAEGESQVSIEAGRQKAEEDQLRRLAESIKESRQGGGERAMERRGDQRQLGQLYNDTVTRKTPISAEVNALVREQMKDATERLQGQAQIAEDGGETMAKGIGGVGGPQAGNPFAKSPFAAAQGKVTPAKPLAQGGFQQGNPRGPEQAQAGPTRAYNDGQPANGNSSQARMRPAREVA